MSEFDEYIVHGVHRESGQKEKSEAWQTAIGLPDVDGQKVSTYLLDAARQYIKGDITIDKACERIQQLFAAKYSLRWDASRNRATKTFLS